MPQLAEITGSKDDKLIMTCSAWGLEYIAVDWGSTNRRAYRLSDGRVIIDSFEDELGVSAVNDGDFDALVAQIRERLGDMPMLLAGAIGSNMGWHEAPYVPCPAGPADIARNIRWIDERTGIVPGVSQLDEPDVMRGEEVQAIGAVELGLAPADGMICHPGTHAKWIMMVGGDIKSLHSAMTGEMFNLLKTYSILGRQLQDAVVVGPAFDAGVNDALEHRPLLSALFSIRPRHLLTPDTTNHASYASGLLIGTDVLAAIEREISGVISLVGRPELCALYARAALLAGRQTVAIDGAKAFTRGMATILEHLR